MTKEQDKETVDTIKSLQGVIKRDEAHFENKMTLISSGAITLLMAFIAGLNGCVYSRCLFVLGIILLGLALTINMASYIVDKCMYRCLMNFLIKWRDKGIYKEPSKRNSRLIKIVDWINGVNLAVLIAGLIVSFLFVYKNIMQ